MLMRLMPFLLILAVIVACAPRAPDAEASGDIDEVFHGVLQIGPQSLRMELELQTGEEPRAALISLDQSGVRIPMAEVDLSDDQMILAQPRLGVRYEGRRVDGRIVGVFSQGGVNADLVFEPGRFETEASGDSSSAEEPDPLQTELTVEAGPVTLAGTLQRPEGEGPFPAMIILSGSGAQDRDGNIAGQPMLAALAQGLADAGIASFRFDDRGVGGSSALTPAGPRDLAADATAILHAIGAREDVSCIGFAGHSEGGLIALLAADEAQPGFILTLAGMHLPMRETLYGQSRALILASGGTPEQAAANRALQDAVLDAIEAEGGGDASEAIEAALLAIGASADLAAQQAQIWGQPYMYASLQIDPSEAAAAYDGPLTAVFAQNDLQVLPAENAAELEQARADLATEIITLEGVDHLFQFNATGLPAQYGAAGHPMQPEALARIGEAAQRLVQSGCRID
ncbi:MAG: alpha/beta hydrolase [Pseudomonadota bacterium]